VLYWLHCGNLFNSYPVHIKKSFHIRISKEMA